MTDEEVSHNRLLIYFPIVHTDVDMGSMANDVERRVKEKSGEDAWQQNQQLKEQLWSGIESWFNQVQLPYEKIHIYQDGLPVNDHVLAIVNELAAAGSRNHCVLKQLIEKGATLMGTESPELLLEEYQVAKDAHSGADGSQSNHTAENQQGAAKLLLERRDNFVAERINKTLPSDGIGIVFLGMLHTLEGKLDKDIQVIRPIQQQAEQDSTTKKEH